MAQWVEAFAAKAEFEPQDLHAGRRESQKALHVCDLRLHTMACASLTYTHPHTETHTHNKNKIKTTTITINL